MSLICNYPTRHLCRRVTVDRNGDLRISYVDSHFAEETSGGVSREPSTLPLRRRRSVSFQSFPVQRDGSDSLVSEPRWSSSPQSQTLGVVFLLSLSIFVCDFR